MGRMTLSSFLKRRVDLGRLITQSLFRRKQSVVMKSQSFKER
uniref:Similar to ubiquitin carboxyl-terminal hydrolase family protein n=1 Tax=Arundo donax TaxID=35708 RepID=A0A0A9CWC3_ARUDO